jgi:hypothetical protein
MRRGILKAQSCGFVGIGKRVGLPAVQPPQREKYGLKHEYPDAVKPASSVFFNI